MPIYRYQCPACGSRRDVLKSLTLLDRGEPCETCQTPMERRICAPAVVADYPGYSCPITGSWVEGRRAHTENLKRHGCRVLETGETDQVRRNHRAEETALDRSVDETVEQFYETLPTERREQLAAEVQSGLDVTIERA